MSTWLIFTETVTYESQIPETIEPREMETVKDQFCLHHEQANTTDQGNGHPRQSTYIKYKCINFVHIHTYVAINIQYVHYM